MMQMIFQFRMCLPRQKFLIQIKCIQNEMFAAFWGEIQD